MSWPPPLASSWASWSPFLQSSSATTISRQPRAARDPWFVPRSATCSDNSSRLPLPSPVGDGPQPHRGGEGWGGLVRFKSLVPWCTNGNAVGTGGEIFAGGSHAVRFSNPDARLSGNPGDHRPAGAGGGCGWLRLDLAHRSHRPAQNHPVPNP